MLREPTLLGDGVIDKVAIAIERLQMYAPNADPLGYYLAFSGGKDSVVLLDLAKRAGVKYEAHYNICPPDPPELMRFIRQRYPEVIRHRPEESMKALVARNAVPPTRIMRYCCSEWKENSRHGRGRFVLTGVRWQESTRRRKRKMLEFCTRDSGKRYLHPIIDWSERDVWQYIRENSVPYCPLYDEVDAQGNRIHKRLGCVMCPMSRERQRRVDAERWPRIAHAWFRACEAAFNRRVERGDQLTWHNAAELYEWWLSDMPGQKDNEECYTLMD